MGNKSHIVHIGFTERKEDSEVSGVCNSAEITEPELTWVEKISKLKKSDYELLSNVRGVRLTTHM